MNICFHPFNIYLSTSFNSDLTYYSNKFEYIIKLLNENKQRNDSQNEKKKRIAILTRNDMILKILTEIVSHFQPVVVINHSLNGYERYKLFNKSHQDDNIILIVDSRMNIIDLDLYYYDYVVVFDNGLSLNKHIIYKPKDLIGEDNFKTVLYILLLLYIYI